MPLTLAAALTAAQIAAPFQIAQMKTSQPAASTRRSAAQASADEELLPEAAPVFGFQNNVGIQYSTLQGSGLCYRNWLGDGLGFSVAGIPYQTMDETQTPPKSSGFVNFGGQLMKAFYEGPGSRLYGLAAYGTGIFYDAGRRDQNISLGVGADWALGPKFLATAAIGYSQATQSRDNGPTTTSFSPGYTFGFFFAF
ncbi:MAG: hypothetical protein VKP72_13685 [bacterium]|nr:hypothetical protein [bacterium]